jgi:hypothetical protein
MLLYFEPAINDIKWSRVIEALKVLHPKLTWASRVNLDSFNPFEAFDPLSQSVISLPPINGLTIDFYNKLSYGRFENPESMLKLRGYGTKVVDGWEYLGMKQDTESIFDKLNESDEFGWAEEIIKDVPNLVDYRTVKQGDKVVPGKDWLFGNQAQGSVYGIVDLEEYGGEPAYIEDSTDEEFHQYWVHVDWVNKNGNPTFRNNYRVGPLYHDLKYYVPKPVKKKKIKESEDDEFEWVKETVSQEYHRYEDILPYLDFDDIISITGDFTDDYGNVLLSVEDVSFKVYKKNNIVYLKWVQPKDERPIDWSFISNSSEEVHMGSSTFEWDKDLMVKILHKEEHPF